MPISPDGRLSSQTWPARGASAPLGEREAESLNAPNFITLTGTNGKPVRVRAERIDAFERLISETAVYIGSETYKITETPEQLLDLLGVTSPLDRMDQSNGIFMPRMWDAAHAVSYDDTPLNLKAIAASHGFEAKAIVAEAPDEVAESDIAEKIAGTPVPDPAQHFGSNGWTLVARWECEDGEIANWFARPLANLATSTAAA